MVTIAIAGGSGQVAREVVDALVRTNQHNIIVLTRTIPKQETDSRATHSIVDYDDVDDLARTLRGVHTVLSFIQILLDIDQKAQRNLVDAAMMARVKRFAPSEYGSSGIANMPWWDGKARIREYLEKINEKTKILEYCLFQPGLFLNYLAFPHKTSKHLDPLGTVFDFENKRAITVKGHENALITLTTVTDFAAIVAMAVNYQGEWPTIGGIQGSKVTVRQISQLGEKIRGHPFSVEQVEIGDLEEGKLTSSWSLEVPHEAVSEDGAATMLEQVTIGMLLSTAKGAWEGSNEMNRLFPEYQFTNLEEFLNEVWK